jgi:dihydroorotate dehydrogenase (fumarate)
MPEFRHPGAVLKVQIEAVEEFMKLTTTYLGLTLAHPFVAGASPLGRDLDHARRLEDGGAAAIVLPSLFEEQITMREDGRVHEMDPDDPRFARLLSAFPEAHAYATGPDEYFDHIRRVKAAVRIPVIGSLNGVTRHAWLKAAAQIEQAGADALELNMYDVAADPQESGAAIERRMRDVILDLKSIIGIPIAVKLSPFFTAITHLAQQIDDAGARGLVLFNRFLQPDIDIATLTMSPRLTLSTSDELLLRLRWIAALRGRVRASLALTGGVETPEDGIKALLAGADVVQIVSAALRSGPGVFKVMRKGLVHWMKAHELASIEDVRGRVRFDQAGTGELSALGRAGYLRTLQSWVETD